MKFVIKKILSKMQSSRSHWLSTVSATLMKTRIELLLLTGVSFHELVFWKVHRKQSDVTDQLKNLEFTKKKEGVI